MTQCPFLSPRNRTNSRLQLSRCSLHDAEIRAIWAGFLDETERFFSDLTHRAVTAGQFRCGAVDVAVAVAVEPMIAEMEGIRQFALFRPQAFLPERERRTGDRLMSLLGDHLQTDRLTEQHGLAPSPVKTPVDIEAAESRSRRVEPGCDLVSVPN